MDTTNPQFQDLVVLAEFVAKTATFMDEAFEDGELSITDLMSAIPLLRSINSLTKVNYPQLLQYLPQIDEEEQEELVAKIKDSLDLVDDSKEVVVENLIEILSAVAVSLMKVIENIHKVVKKAE